MVSGRKTDASSFRRPYYFRSEQIDQPAWDDVKSSALRERRFASKTELSFITNSQKVHKCRRALSKVPRGHSKQDLIRTNLGRSRLRAFSKKATGP